MFILPLLFSFIPLASTNDRPPPNVLVYSIKSGFSHANFMGRLSDILSESGMNVTTLISILRLDVGDGTTRSHIVYSSPNDKAFELWNEEGDDSSSMFRGSSQDVMSIIRQTPRLKEAFALQCLHTIKQKDLLDKLKESKFDVVLTENFDYCGFGIAKLIGAKTIVTVSSSSMSDHLSWTTGTPLPLSTIHSSFSGNIDRSFSSRIWNIVCSFANFYFNIQTAQGADWAFKQEYGNDFPNVESIMSSSSLIITAADPLVDIARPTLRKVIDIGAIGVRESKPLTKEYDDLLNLRPKSIILSFGSVAQSYLLPTEYKRSIVEAFSRFPNVTFIWKYEKPEEAVHTNGHDNIYLRKWIPQNDLLGDPRISAFISHGGKTSLNEVGDKGVPVIMVPLFADQPRNAAIAKKLGFGFVFEKDDLSNADKIEEAVNEILNNDKYKKAALFVSSTVKERPFSSREILVKNVDFVAKFGNIPSLDNEGLDLPLFIYWNLDIVLVVLITLLTTVSIILYSTLNILRFIFHSKSSVVSKRKKRN